MGTKKIIKKSTNSFLVEKFNQEVEKIGHINKKCLGGYLIYHLRLEEIFFEKKFQKMTSVNFVGPDPRLLELGAK